MDLKAYYRKLRDTEKSLRDEFVVLKSRATADGGVAGRLTEVTRAVAAKMLVDGTADVAEKQEAEAFRQKRLEEKEQEEQKRVAAKVQFTVLTESDLRALQKPARGSSKE
ncbi:MAG TPA: hypothetical protein VEU62_04170 [Bryobacterales bacterium]|nr:hypothetical protein [Bryobacterales bacterium]